MKYLIHILLLLTITGCSSLFNKKIRNDDFTGARVLASESTCAESIKKFFKNEVTEDELNIVLKERKLISLSDKLITVNYPKLDWINDTKKSLTNQIKSWNRNKYPLFYLDNDSQIIPLAKSYAELMSKDLAGNLDDEGKKSLSVVTDWIKSYKSYQADLDVILEERISLQYNLNMLKKIKLEANEVRDIKLTFKRDGAFVSEVITLRKDDKNLKFTMNSLKDQIKELDGKVNGVGKIHERVIKQAMARDLVTIVQRELEYSVKNTPNIAPEISAHLDELNTILKDVNFEPSTFGVYKINNQVFKTEIADLFRSSSSIKQTSTKNHVNVRQYIEKFFSKTAVNDLKEVAQDAATVIAKELKDAATKAPIEEIKKEGFLKRIYSKIATFTPYQKFMASTKVGLLGYGAYRFFWFHKDGNSVEVFTGLDKEVTPETPDKTAHQEQLDTTKKLEEDKSNGNSSVIEIHLENIILEKHNK